MANSRVKVRGAFSSLRQVQSLKQGDVFVWVGSCGNFIPPWANLSQRGVRTVYYQTEPMPAYAKVEFLNKGWLLQGVDEVWSYSQANIDVLHRDHAPMVAGRTLRHVPPGVGGAATVGSGARRNATALVFLGTLTTERAACKVP